MKKKVMVGGIDVIKALYFSTASIILILIFSFFILIPNLKQYGKIDSETKKLSKDLTTHEEKSKHTHEELSHLELQNKRIIEGLKLPFDGKRFIQTYQEQIHNIELKEEAKTPEGEFEIITYSLKGECDNPKAFYYFIDRLKEDKNIIRLADNMVLKVTDTKKIALEIFFFVYFRPETHATSHETPQTTPKDHSNHTAPATNKHE